MRNNLMKIVVAVGLAGAVGTSGAATTLNGLAAGGLYFNYYGIEQVNQYNAIANGSGGFEGNWGLIQVSSVYNANILNPNQSLSTGSSMLWNNGSGNGQIIGLFYGVNFTANPQVATGGQIDLYWLPNATSAFDVYNLNPANRTAANQFNGVTNALNAQLLMSSSFSTGSVPYYGPTSPAGWNTSTVYSTTDPMMSNGSASSYLSVNAGAGAWGATMDSNWFLKNTNGQSLTGNVTYFKPPVGPTFDSGMTYAGGAQDARTSNSYEVLAGASIWNDYGNGTVGFNISSGAVTSYISSPTPTVAFDSVPEPGTVSAIGAALVALAFGRRRIRRVY